jgi:proteasome-associated ATPase
VPQSNARGEGRPDDGADDEAWAAAAAGRSRDGGSGRISEDDLTLLQAELALLRDRVGAAPERIAALEDQLSAVQQELESSVAQNGRLAETLRSARGQIAELKAEVERLSAPPHSYGTYVGPAAEGGLTVSVQGRKVQVEPTAQARPDLLEPGQELLLNDALQVVGVGRFEDRGELMTVSELLDDGRALVVGRSDEERLVHLAGRIREAGVRAGDTVLVDVRSGTASERVERSEVDRLVLEEVPDVDFAAIGGLGPQIEAIRDAIELPYVHADLYERYDLRAPKGILLYGPPGCGKTMIAKAVASSLARRVTEDGGAPVRSHFLNVKGPELLNKYVGETERQIRLIFQRARERSREGHPVVVFFDEMEALFRTRGSGVSTDVETTIVPQLLAEIDGVESLRDVIVIGASNREDMIDPAILRPGRLDVKIRVDRPDRVAAREILALSLTPGLPLDGRLLADFSGDRAAAASRLVEIAVERVYAESSDSEFLEVRYAGGGSEVLHFHDFSSGAMLASIVARAKRRAVKRQVAGLADGVGVIDVEGAVIEEFRENEDLPSTSSPEDWSRISGRRGEPVVAIRRLAGAAPADQA